MARRFGVEYVTDSIKTATDVRSSDHAAALIGTGILNEIAWTGIAIGFLIFVYALLVGPTRGRRDHRRGLSPIL